MWCPSTAVFRGVGQDYGWSLVRQHKGLVCKSNGMNTKNVKPKVVRLYSGLSVLHVGPVHTAALKTQRVAHTEELL